MDAFHQVFSFPRTINEKAARVVAAVVATLALVALLTGAHWLLAPLAYGFWARVLTGPTLSPLGRLASGVVAPRLGAPKLVPGPPKRFAQGMGAAITTLGAVAWAADLSTLAGALLAMLLIAATLEAAFALCLGCRIFAVLMRVGVIPETVCAECANLNLRATAR